MKAARVALAAWVLVTWWLGPTAAVYAQTRSDASLEGHPSSTAALNAAATDSSAVSEAQSRVLSAYERDSLDTGLSRLGVEVDSLAEGKIVQSVEVVVLDVFEPRDPAPGFLNWFHVNTLESVVAREVLLHPGQPYRAVLAAESERNLRRFVQFSVVLVTAVKGTEPGKVRILVVTKDVWSLRVSWDPAFAQGKLTQLALVPSEWNLFGTTQTLSGTFLAGANTYWVGGSYNVPRVAGSRITTRLTANVQMNCQSGKAEGGRVQFSYGQPLYSTRTAWAWGVSADYLTQVVRVGFGNVNSICSSPGAGGVRVNLSETPVVGRQLSTVAYIPNVYRNEAFAGSLGLTRSFFVRNKINVGVGLEAVRVRNSPVTTSNDVYVGQALYSPNESNRTCWPPTAQCRISDGVEAEPASGLDLEYVRARFAEQRLSPSLFRLGPYLQLNAFETQFVRVLNFNTLGLQEDVQLGHNVGLRLYPGVRPLASRNSFGTDASVSYTLASGGGVYRLTASSKLEMSGSEDEFGAEGAARSSLADARVELQAHLVSPDVGLGRFVVGTAYLDNPQWRRVAPQVELGSFDRLRGYPPGWFSGRTLFVNNTEFRTRPVELFSTHLGGVAFWDVGGAADGANNIPIAHGVGVGLRVLLPQIDRQVFRIDLGVPVESAPFSKLTLTAGFRQVFGDN